MMIHSLFWILAWAALTTAGGKPLETREWMDASGTKRATAVLLRIEDETLWLRRADGKVTSTTVSQLSALDRQYVALHRRQSTLKPKPQKVLDAVVNAASQLDTIRQLPERLAKNQLDAQLRPVPAALVYIRVSKAFLANYFEREVVQRKDVQDCILGTRIVGYSHTRGRSGLTLIPNSSGLNAKITFDGTVSSHTRGYKSPVVLNNVADSVFQAEKSVALGDFGLRVSSASADVTTRLHTNSISTSLPRLRGRIATRIAWRRVQQSHHEAEEITAQHTADDIRTDFDKRIDRSLEKVRSVFWARVSDLETARHPMPTDVRYRTATEYVEMALIREDATAEERKLRPPNAGEDSDVAVRLHRTLFTSAMQDPQLIQSLAPILTKLLEARAKEIATGSARGKEPQAQWDINLDWVSLDLKDQ